MPLFPDATLWLLSPTAFLWGLTLLIRAATPRPHRRAAALLGLTAIIGGVAGGACAAYLESQSLWNYDGDTINPIQVAALGVLLFAVALTIWSYRGDRPRGRRRCPKCWYDMTGLALSCPECGHSASRETNLFRPRRRRRGVVIGLLLMLFAYAGWVAPRVRTDGPLAAVPSWVLVVGLPYLPDSCIGSDLRVRLSLRLRTLSWPNPSSLGSRLGNNELVRPERWFVHARARQIVLACPDFDQLIRVKPFLSDTSLADPAIEHAVGVSIMKGLASSKSARRQEAALVLAVESSRSVAHLEPAEVRPYFAGLLAALNDPEPFVCDAAAAYAVQAGPDADELVPRILQVVGQRSPTTDVLRGALRTAARASPRATQAVLDASTDPNVDIRRASAFALGSPEAGQRAGAARLNILLSDPDLGVQFLAATSLIDGALPPAEAIPVVLRWHQEPHLNSAQVLSSLTKFKPEILALHAALFVPLLTHPSVEISMAAEAQLYDLAGNPALDLTPAIEPLEAFARDTTSPEGRAAIQILERYRTALGRNHSP